MLETDWCRWEDPMPVVRDKATLRTGQFTLSVCPCPPAPFREPGSQMPRVPYEELAWHVVLMPLEAG